MKKLLTLCLGFLPCAALAATNKISMVTYFPVPYVAYSQVNTTEQMDIGLTSTCDMKLGCSEESATLNATRVNLKGGKLNLDGGLGIKGYSLNLGSGYGDGKISFQNVRIQTGNMESVNAADIKAANLNLFGKAFPSCKSANSESGGQMQWTSLKLKGASSSELYLACGALKDTPCCSSDELSKGKVCNASTHTCECPDGKTENSSGYCVQACDSSKKPQYILLNEEEAAARLTNGNVCDGWGENWRGKTSPHTCNGKNRYTCLDVYRAGGKIGIFVKDYYTTDQFNGMSDCGIAEKYIYVPRWEQGHPSVKIEEWMSVTRESGPVESWSGPKNYCENPSRLPQQIKNQNKKSGNYALAYCYPWNNASGAWRPQDGFTNRTHVFGYCKVMDQFMYAEVTCCP
ncbi:MAG: hypothetical protein Q4P84_01470 [Elusimicrobiales bacterium]|nr:hypothetical protein [Elusimicrobiales bacterium]